MAEKQTGRKPTNRRDKDRKYAKNVTLEIPIIICDVNQNGVHYNTNSLFSKLDFLASSGVFDILSVPVKMNNEQFYDRKGAKGMSNVGFVRGYNHREKTLTCTIYSNCIDRVKSLVPPAIFVQGVAYKDELSTILTFEICEEIRYTNILKTE